MDIRRQAAVSLHVLCVRTSGDLCGGSWLACWCFGGVGCECVCLRVCLRGLVEVGLGWVDALPVPAVMRCVLAS